MYQLQAVTHTYQRRGQSVTALENVNVEISTNDFIAVVGPSGSGKTTLLSVLGGMLAPTAGQVVLDGTSVYDMPIADRAALRQQAIGFVFQSFNLIPWLSARENVQIPLMLAGKSSDEQQRRSLELLDRVGLSDRTEHRPAELSQGQQQRVALARTLANDPAVILADEPTGNLDAGTRAQVMEYLAEFHAEGRTIILVTHDAETAAFAQRTIRLVAGVAQDAAQCEAA